MILVTGGAGYIGSHVVRALVEQGLDAVVYDRKPMTQVRLDGEPLLPVPFVVADLADERALDQTFEKYPFDAVIHLAGDIVVSESTADPGKYYANNIGGGLKLLGAMRRHGVMRIVFSSTAALFGMPRRVPIADDDPVQPINPYGRTKWMFEQMLADYDAAYGLRFVSLRYFNASGAHPSGLIGEAHHPETHLIPLVLQVPLELRLHVDVFGTDYNTPDGTAIRDYIHVCDLADAHVLALKFLRNATESRFYNLGNGLGHSVRQVIAAAEQVVGKPIRTMERPRRPGDAERLVASSERIIRHFGWQPRYADLHTIVETAWRWHKRIADCGLPIAD